MTRSTFNYVTYIRTTQENLWSALTEPRLIRQYWFNYSVLCDWKKGSSWTLVKPDGSPVVAGEVLEIATQQHFAIRWQDQLRPELIAEGPSRCMFKVEPAGSAVKLTITHEIDLPDSKLIHLVSDSWPQVISNLKSLLETNSVALQEPYHPGAINSAKGVVLAKAIFGNHSSVIVPRQDRDNIRKFYCDVLGGTITKEENDRDFLRLGDNFYIGFLYGEVPDESEFLRTARSVWLEIKSGNVDEMKRRILESGLVRKLEVPDPHLYFQAPGGQCLRLVGIDEDLSFYEGTGDGPNVANVKEAIQKEALTH